MVGVGGQGRNADSTQGPGGGLLALILVPGAVVCQGVVRSSFGGHAIAVVGGGGAGGMEGCQMAGVALVGGPEARDGGNRGATPRLAVGYDADPRGDVVD